MKTENRQLEIKKIILSENDWQLMLDKKLISSDEQLTSIKIAKNTSSFVIKLSDNLSIEKEHKKFIFVKKDDDLVVKVENVSKGSFLIYKVYLINKNQVEKILMLNFSTMNELNFENYQGYYLLPEICKKILSELIEIKKELAEKIVIDDKEISFSLREDQAILASSLSFDEKNMLKEQLKIIKELKKTKDNTKK